MSKCGRVRIQKKSRKVGNETERQFVIFSFIIEKICSDQRMNVTLTLKVKHNKSMCILYGFFFFFWLSTPVSKGLWVLICIIWKQPTSISTKNRTITYLCAVWIAISKLPFQDGHFQIFVCFNTIWTSISFENLNFYT